MQGESGKKSPFLSPFKRGHILMEEGVKIFFSHVPYSILFKRTLKPFKIMKRS